MMIIKEISNLFFIKAKLIINMPLQRQMNLILWFLLIMIIINDKQLKMNILSVLMVILICNLSENA